MKRASYREAVAWIADNDAAGDDDALDPEVVAGYVTSALVAALFDDDVEKVSKDVVAYRA